MIDVPPENFLLEFPISSSILENSSFVIVLHYNLCMQDREKFTQNAILVQIELFKLKTKNSQKNSISEFRELALSSGAEIFGEVIGKQDRPRQNFI